MARLTAAQARTRAAEVRANPDQKYTAAVDSEVTRAVEAGEDRVEVFCPQQYKAAVQATYEQLGYTVDSKPGDPYLTIIWDVVD